MLAISAAALALVAVPVIATVQTIREINIRCDAIDLTMQRSRYPSLDKAFVP